ncbi:sll0787 family AIR synthase-like protein [Paenibacillus polysaccharolyticus]|uniref:sll0787 family AIR synthase-like protein n=1 Tax=Paenibacillus polysaccharolyticus TaxID=582692 RepID=UPI0020A08B99|nr:sll0787 family AIR synthase-like protein [Paenibacillus polysaccharolyticus]MCP1136233.1 sll0787 family AIR synthase-like protein [Paenibacillus polysaccharolyticus]
MDGLENLVKRIADSSGFMRKKDIQIPLQAFAWDPAAMLDPIGDDAAILKNGDDYLLISCDGILPRLVQVEPKWAGYCAVLVSVSDIYAMGGRPVAIVNLLSAPNGETAGLIAEGMAEGCRRLGVPMVGGHYLPEEAGGVATAILGRATHLLRGCNGRAGQSLIVAVDLNGKPYKHYPQWDCTSTQEPEVLHRKLELLPMLAENGWATAARDISNAGILGTIAMLAENSVCGAQVQIDHIPRPGTVELERWLQMFPGYGFILAANPEHTDEIISLFAQEDIAAAVVGELTLDTCVSIRNDTEAAILIDWAKESLVVTQYEQRQC